MINEFLKRLTPNFSNIEEVYNELLLVYNPDNINTTELIFIESVKFENVEQSENILKLSMFLGKKTSNVKFYNIDYYNYYLKKKRFGFTLPLTYSTKQTKKEPFTVTIDYKEFLNILNDYKQRYEYIFNKLSNVDKTEFKNDFCDQLKKNKKFQTESKFKEAIKDLIKFINIISEVPKQDKEIGIYLKSYNQTQFDEISNKRNEDGTPNNFYLGNNFNEWLENINKNLYSNNSYDTETQEKLSDYNKYLCALANNLISLYKAISGYEKTKNTAFKTSIHLKEKEVFNRLNSINFYAEIIKTFIRNKQYSKANDIQDYCLALFDNLTYNLNDVLTIDVYKSPLEIHFDNYKIDLENSINLEELKILAELNKSKEEKTIQTLNNFVLINYQNKTVKQSRYSIFFTLKEYESIYEDRLFEHFKIHVDYDTDHFIFEEKRYYEFYLNLINSIGCVPDDMMNEKHKFPIINIGDFDYNNLYFKEGVVEIFFYKGEENNKGYVVIEEVMPDVMNVINLFKNLTFDEFVFKSYNLKNSFRLILKFLKGKKKENNFKIIKEKIDLTGDRIKQIKSQHPTFNPNLWSSDCFELFKYLFECYYNDKTRQLTNIWFYLKECGIKKYNIKATKDKYKVFILENYNIKITNFDKAQIKWEDKERETIDEHRINFEDSLK